MNICRVRVKGWCIEVAYVLIVTGLADFTCHMLKYLCINAEAGDWKAVGITSVVCIVSVSCALAAYAALRQRIVAQVDLAHREEADRASRASLRANEHLKKQLENKKN